MNNGYLLDEFYFIAKKDVLADGLIQAEVGFNVDHGIFGGHFPGMAVVPGVCMIQMIKETLAQHLGRNLVLVSADSIKYHALIVPERGRTFFIEIAFGTDGETVPAKARIHAQEKLYMKISGVYRKIGEDGTARA